MSGNKCNDCGAEYANAHDSCTTRFDALLALDHSRSEPWGSRHALAFAAFALQHPHRYSAGSVEQSWRILHRIFVHGDELDRVVKALAGRDPNLSASWDVPARSTRPLGFPTVNISQLGDFAADTYPEMIEKMCRATVEWWSGAPTNK